MLCMNLKQIHMQMILANSFPKFIQLTKNNHIFEKMVDFVLVILGLYLGFYPGYTRVLIPSELNY